MNFQQFATSGYGTRLWMLLARLFAPRAGYPLARAIAGFLSQRTTSSLYRAVYANQSVVLGPSAPPHEVHCAVGAVLQHAGRASYDLMHIVSQGESAIRASVDIGPSVWADAAAAMAGGSGVMLCGSHISNFNLGFLTIALSGQSMQILSAARQAGGFEIIGRLRSRGMLEDTPIDGPSLRAAIRRLRGGGVVLTAADWPDVPGESELLPFFGLPARLPTGHIRLAISGNARLLPVACRWEAKRGYYVDTCPPLDLELTGDRVEDVRHNARRVLAVIERWIAERPEQWLMYHPVWEAIPDAAF
jgi:KDO2-lipid IV(A) lauroyltransferase